MRRTLGGMGGILNNEPCEQHFAGRPSHVFEKICDDNGRPKNFMILPMYKNIDS